MLGRDGMGAPVSIKRRGPKHAFLRGFEPTLHRLRAPLIPQAYFHIDPAYKQNNPDRIIRPGLSMLEDDFFRNSGLYIILTHLLGNIVGLPDG